MLRVTNKKFNHKSKQYVITFRTESFLKYINAYISIHQNKGEKILKFDENKKKLVVTLDRTLCYYLRAW